MDFVSFEFARWTTGYTVYGRGNDGLAVALLDVRKIGTALALVELLCAIFSADNLGFNPINGGGAQR